MWLVSCAEYSAASVCGCSATSAHRRLHRKNLAVGSSDFTGLVADAGSSSAGYMNSNGRSLYLATRIAFASRHGEVQFSAQGHEDAKGGFRLPVIWSGNRADSHESTGALLKLRIVVVSNEV
jgi:hypothetical protein